mmetsp:Transcript_8252/g.20414  ORF Transcript_8252/g.20414 Transcript_8252/m.20414 type:complete len:207 (-) Transcript_8252:145-765(-)
MHANIQTVWGQHHSRKVHENLAGLLSPWQGRAPHQDERTLGLPLSLSRVATRWIGGPHQGGWRIQGGCPGLASPQARIFRAATRWGNIAHASAFRLQTTTNCHAIGSVGSRDRQSPGASQPVGQNATSGSSASVVNQHCRDRCKSRKHRAKSCASNQANRNGGGRAGVACCRTETYGCYHDNSQQRHQDGVRERARLWNECLLNVI